MWAAEWRCGGCGCVAAAPIDGRRALIVAGAGVGVDGEYTLCGAAAEGLPQWARARGGGALRSSGEM